MKLGATKTSIKISTTQLSEEIGGSQQSASRHLQLLETDGMLERTIASEGSKVRITGAGQAELDLVLKELKWYLEGKEAQTIVFEGEVVSGLFEGAYYISKEGYHRQILDKLGFEPFPGTLNVRIKEEDFDKRRRLERGEYIRLDGFKDGERSFGAAHCFPCLINDELGGALIVAERSIHDYGVMEIISPFYLRRKMELADGDKVKLSFLPLRRSDA
ncbi:CTP-dependent riboflavin kinase [Candidatus Bathyarchaeota archaeon]|nr:CTP-dependent riboflavin kinase [Candidatus Bathyarchaeota archaeon]